MTTGMKIILLLAEIITVASAVVVAIHPNVLYSAIFLLFAFLGVAVMFVYAGADFLAGAQVIVYVGGVTILILFAIMLTQWLYQIKLRDVRNKFIVPALVLALGFVPFLFKGVRQMAQLPVGSPPEELAKTVALPKTGEMGIQLLSNYLLPFEAVTILLLGALVGAVWLARPKS